MKEDIILKQRYVMTQPSDYAQGTSSDDLSLVTLSFFLFDAISFAVQLLLTGIENPTSG